MLLFFENQSFFPKPNLQGGNSKADYFWESSNLNSDIFWENPSPSKPQSSPLNSKIPSLSIQNSKSPPATLNFPYHFNLNSNSTPNWEYLWNYPPDNPIMAPISQTNSKNPPTNPLSITLPTLNQIIPENPPSQSALINSNSISQNITRNISQAEHTCPSLTSPHPRHPESTPPVTNSSIPKPSGTKPIQPFQYTYSRRNTLKEVVDKDTPHDQEQGSDSSTEVDLSKLDLPIAVRKGTRKCTQHPISNFLCYERPSDSMKAFVTHLAKQEVPKNFQEAWSDPRW